MKATYDARTDTLSIILKTDTAVAESDEDQNYEKFIDAGARRARPSAAAAAKKGKAAWSKLEDVLADRRLKKELNDFEEE